MSHQCPLYGLTDCCFLTALAMSPWIITTHYLGPLAPAPREDEPAGLRRQDIVDELADHLTCASINRELLRGTDPTAARALAVHYNRSR